MLPVIPMFEMALDGPFYGFKAYQSLGWVTLEVPCVHLQLSYNQCIVL